MPPLLFTPLSIKDVTFKNRVVIAPMATYAARDGIAQDFHFAHWGRLALGGAGCVFVEATVEPQFAERISQEGRVDLVAIGRDALVNPCWPQMAEIALGRKPVEAMDDWSIEYGCCLKHREWAIERIRADRLASSGET